MSQLTHTLVLIAFALLYIAALCLSVKIVRDGWKDE